MIAIVEPIGQGGEMNPIKWKYFNPRLPQCPYEFPSQTSTSECIIDYTNLYAGTRLFHQNFGNLVPDSSFLEDVILQVNMVTGRTQRSEHLRKLLFAVDKQLNPVPGCERTDTVLQQKSHETAPVSD